MDVDAIGSFKINHPSMKIDSVEIDNYISPNNINPAVRYCCLKLLLLYSHWSFVQRHWSVMPSTHLLFVDIENAVSLWVLPIVKSIYSLFYNAFKFSIHFHFSAMAELTYYYLQGSIYFSKDSVS